MNQNTALDLYTTIREHVENPEVAALLTESEMVPISGTGSPVAPPTYAHDDGVKSKKPNFAISEDVPVPAKTDNGWYQSLEKDPHSGGIRRASQVIIDSIGAQAGGAESALIGNQKLGSLFPGIFVQGGDTPKRKDNQASPLSEQVQRALDTCVSTWNAAHRQADAWIKFAQTPDGKQVWEGGRLENGEELKETLLDASPENGELLYSLLPNSALYGYWLSSGTARRHKMPRSYSSQIVGYGAIPISVGSTMMNANGGASGTSAVSVIDNKLSVNQKGGKPSAVGFGPIPSPPAVRGFSCELILQRATISLANLRHIKFQSRDRQNAALSVLTLMGILGHLLANQDGFYRSGCALVVTDSRWGWRRQGNGALDLEELSIESIGQVEDALRIAIDRAAETGLEFRAPIRLTFSDAQRTLIADRIKAEESKQEIDGKDD